jgi:hypothetical protein
MRMALSFILTLSVQALPALSHEYWIEAQKFHPASVQELTADLRVGSNLSGEVFPWLKQSFASVSLSPPEGDPIPLSGRAGDLPALRFTPLSEGLHRIAVETTPSFVIFDKPETFPSYVAYEGFPEVLDQHRARGLPETGFGERFTRNARALLQIGAVEEGQSDAPSGLPLELVAEGNPYAPGLTEIAVRLTWQGDPLAGTQVALFHAAPDAARPADVTRTLFRTDADGRVIVPIMGSGLHLLSAVRIEPVEDSAAAAWQSWWASLTFAPD